MEEIRKVQRVIRKADPGAPHETLLVLDANTGQNALAQVKAFDDALGLTGLVLTKLDGSAKGGVVAAIAKERPIPLRFIGVGEGVDDLKPFVADGIRRRARRTSAAAGPSPTWALTSPDASACTHCRRGRFPSSREVRAELRPERSASTSVACAADDGH